MNYNHFPFVHNDSNLLGNSKYYWRALFDKALDAMLITDDQGCYIDVNPAACELFGLPRGELLGCNISQFTMPDFDFSGAWSHFLLQGELKGEFRLLRRNGDVRDTEFSATANFLPHRHLSIMRDVTESKQSKAVLQYSRELAAANKQLKHEIRERQLVEETLQKTQTFLSQIINTIPDPVFVKNESHQWVNLNDAFCKMIGVNQAELIGKTDYDCFQKEEADFFLEKDQVVLNTGITQENENFLTNTQGETRIVITKKSLLKDALGEKIIVGVMRDITESKLAEVALRDSENRFRSIFEQAVFGMIIASIEGCFLQVNQRFCEIVGYSSSELINLSYKDFTSSDTHEQDDYWHLLLAGEISTYSQEKRYVCKDSSLVWVKVTISLMNNSVGDQYVIGIVEDINKFKKSEESLHHREEQFKALVENSPDIIARYDQGLKYLYVNPAMEKVTGISPKAFIGKSHQELRIFTEACATLNKAIQAVFLTEQEQVTEFDCATPNGLRLYQSRLVPEFTKTGIIHSVLSVSRDLTAHKQAEAELQQAKISADIANRAKSDFLTNISHELRTPLNGILGYTQILRQDSNLVDRQKNSLNIIYQCGKYLLMLIDDILDLSKIEAQKTELHFTEFYFENFLSNLVELFRMRAQQKGISFNYESLAPLPEIIRADEKRLRQILINLLSNAVKFTDLGEVIFKVGLVTNKAVNSEQLDYFSSKVKIRFEVEDTGIGISQSQIGEIFLPFCQVGDHSRFTEGTGLGLAISQKLVQFMGSSIQVKSTLNKGSIFWFDLDLHQSLECCNTSFWKSPHILGFQTNKSKVLVVDEHQGVRLFLRELLEPLGLIILEAINGPDCLGKAKEFQPNLILMDLAIPLSNNFDLQSLQNLGLASTTIIALSASTFTDIRQNSFDLGFQDFLAKPVQAKELLRLIIKYLGVDNIPKTQLFNTEDKPNLLVTPVVTPSASELLALSRLAQMGDITEFINYSERLEKSNPELAAFTAQTLQLAKGFKLKQLLEFLNQSSLDNKV